MRFSIILSALVVCSVIISVEDGFSADGRKIAISQSESAKTVYDKGFAQGVMREGNEAVKLWNHTLFEDDAPGSGTSNKGSFLEPVFGDRVIKKVLRVDEPRCMEAHVVFYTHSRGKPPLTITVNGNTKKYSYQGPESYAYVPIEPSWLKKGNNEIIFACPEAKDKGSGYVFYISRADEYIPGGGDPAALGIQQGMGIDSGINLIIKGRDEFEEPVTAREGIGKNSMISTNGGRSWSNKGKGMLHQSITKDYGSETKFDEDGVVGEYTARLNLTQYVYEGNLISPVIDLWSEPDNKAALIPFTEVEKLTLSFQGVTPPETQIVWQIRTGLSMDPYSEKDWSQWFTVATGNSSTVEPKGRVNMQPSHWDPERSVTLPKIRYIQWRAILTTNDPLRTPHVTSVSVR